MNSRPSGCLMRPTRSQLRHCHYKLHCAFASVLCGCGFFFNASSVLCVRRLASVCALQTTFGNGFHGTCGLVAMTSASHAEGRQFDPGQVYFTLGRVRENYTWPGSNWRPSACWADVIATRPQVLGFPILAFKHNCDIREPQARIWHQWQIAMQLCCGPHRLVVRTSRRGRDNPGSTPGVDIFPALVKIDHATHRCAACVV